MVSIHSTTNADNLLCLRLPTVQSPYMVKPMLITCFANSCTQQGFNFLNTFKLSFDTCLWKENRQFKLAYLILCLCKVGVGMRSLMYHKFIKDI